MRKRRLWADLALILVAFIWGVAFVVQRVAAAEVQAFVFNGIRFLLGAIVILPFALARTLQAVVDNEPDVPGYPGAGTLYPLKYGLSY